MRTASILLAEGEPCSGVQAGMLHASPVLHLFDKSRRRPPFAAAGRPLRREFGEEVDALVTEYGCVLWGQEERKRHLEALAAPSSPLRRSALRIRVANELEELLDAAMAYAHRRPEEEWQGRIEDTAVAAEKLDHPVLAAELREAWLIQQTSSVPETLRVEASESYERPRRHWREATLIERAARRLRRGRRADA